jgi:cytochrome c peroxidase
MFCKHNLVSNLELLLLGKLVFFLYSIISCITCHRSRTLVVSKRMQQLRTTGQSNAQFNMPEVVVLYAVRDRHTTCCYFTKKCRKRFFNMFID